MMMFRGEYAFLSNFYEAEVVYDNVTYHTAEAAYQAQKAANPAMKEIYARMTGQDAAKAKKMSRMIPARTDWNSVKVNIMRDILRDKFTRSPYLRKKLLNTQGELVEGNYWHDTFWGVDANTGKGENQLGKLLMELREGLKNE